MINKIYLIDDIIRYVTTGWGFDIESVIVRKNDGTTVEASGKKLLKCISDYFQLSKFYPEIANLPKMTKLQNLFIDDFKLYQEKNLVNVKLDEDLKSYLNTLNNKKIRQVLHMYYQDRLTNKEVIRYIKELIVRKNLYIYDRYLNYTKEECEKEIRVLIKIFDILDVVEFNVNNLGIKEKYISFEVGSYEYENISPFLCFDEYDIKFYRNVLELLKEKLLEF